MQNQPYLDRNRDIEDAIVLYELFKDYIDLKKLQKWKEQLGVIDFEP